MSVKKSKREINSDLEEAVSAWVRKARTSIEDGNSDIEGGGMSFEQLEKVLSLAIKLESLKTKLDDDEEGSAFDIGAGNE